MLAFINTFSVEAFIFVEKSKVLKILFEHKNLHIKNVLRLNFYGQFDWIDKYQATWKY